jgi:BRCT domain type II-containing protein
MPKIGHYVVATAPNGAPFSNGMVGGKGKESMSHKLVSQVFHPERQTFVMPVPGMNGAKACSLKGKTFVLTGIFPEVGGGQGLNLGKDKVETMITSFGGTVTSAISGMYAHDKHLLAGLR